MANRMVTVKTLQRWYKRINRGYFNNSLPHTVDIRIVDKIDAKNSAWAETSNWMDEEGALEFYQIKFVKYLVKFSRTFTCLVLYHEMCHLAAGLHNGHNKVFDKNISRLFRKGAYKGIL